MCHTMMCQFQDHKGHCSIDIQEYHERHDISPCVVGCPGGIDKQINSTNKELVYLNASMNGYKFNLKHDYSLTDEQINNFILFSQMDCFNDHRENVDFTLLSTILSLQKRIATYTRQLRFLENQLCRKRKFTE